MFNVLAKFAYIYIIELLSIQNTNNYVTDKAIIKGKPKLDWLKWDELLICCSGLKSSKCL